MIVQSCHEKGVKNIQNRTSLLDWSGTIIWRLDCIYGWVKSTNLNRSLVIVKSATTPSTSYDHACNIHHVKTSGNIVVEHIINQNLINPRCMLCKYHYQVVEIMSRIIHELYTFKIYLHHNLLWCIHFWPLLRALVLLWVKISIFVTKFAWRYSLNNVIQGLLAKRVYLLEVSTSYSLDTSFSIQYNKVNYSQHI